ncbi:MAG: 60 kDa chaperonin [Parcubacteria group bacterium GW2011_GWC1_45_9]|nr:MAG: 60 kDa chaperonin [Parcubacteria group bacterium GW2011_GWA1_Parcubacteria_45_10]KKT87689.1 MAG: 60 kDa chaperonin [Parcubacteria group bacterium GW2011_GWB1_45_10]KKU16892.1 MAG: 60 kDa chaperonin [Parcubacteria group bacterium GW2011_GWC1_45_9]
MSKQILYKDKAREALKRGVDKVVNAVKVTLGPKGRNVILDKSYGSPVITKDGVTVAKEITLENRFENIAAELVKEASQKTADIAGDGTTTAAILVQAIVNEGFAQIASGSNPVLLKKGIDKALARVLEMLTSQSIKVEDKKKIEEVAAISANDPEIGRMIAEIFNEIGKEGVLTVEESQTLGFSREIVEGLQFDRGYVSPYMITDTERMEAILEDPYILITDQKISSMNELLPVLEKVVQAGKKNIVLIAEDIEGEALATLIVNKLRGTFSALAIKAPGFGDRRKEMLEDIAVVTGGKVITPDLGMKLENASLEMLGQAHRVVANKDNSTIVDGKGEKTKIDERVRQLKLQLEKSDSSFDKEKIEERLAKLSGGVAVIKVGAVTETEMKEIKYRVEDAIHATRAALEEGIVPGGGVALFDISLELRKKKEELFPVLGDEYRGVELLLRALEYPIRTVVENSGKSAEDVFNTLMKENKTGFGFNALTGEFTDMIQAGILDPTKVVKSALSNAASVAGLILISEAVVADKPEEKGKEKMPGGYPGEEDY